MPTLQELANNFCEDNDFEYVELESKKVGSLKAITVGSNTSIFTKLKEYPYEFEINNDFQLASIDGIQVAVNHQTNEELQVQIQGMQTIIDAQDVTIKAQNKKITDLENDVSDLAKEVSDLAAKVTTVTTPNTMSATGHQTGEFYYNGKPIYEKTIYISSLANKSNKSYNHNIADVDAIWVNPSKSYIIWKDGKIGTLPYTFNNSDGSIGISNVDSSQFTIFLNADRSGVQAYVTLNYTKTTDTGNGTTITATPAN